MSPPPPPSPGLLLVPQTETGDEGELLCLDRGNPKRYDAEVEEYSGIHIHQKPEKTFEDCACCGVEVKGDYFYSIS